MQYIIGIAIVLYIIYLILCAIYWFFTEFLAGAAMWHTILWGGLLWGVIIAVAHFISSLRILADRPSRKKIYTQGTGAVDAANEWIKRKAEKWTQSEEPAWTSYFSINGDWILNNIHICVYIFMGCASCIKCYASQIAKTWDKEHDTWFWLMIIPVFFFQVFRMASVSAGTLLFIPLIFIPFLLSGIAVFVPIFAMSCILYIVERLFMLVRGIFVLCPECSRHISQPVYVCSGCGKQHRKLSPSPRYGAFYHTCKCGKRLPATRFLGRNRLDSICPHENCGASLSAKSEDVKPLTFAFIGGTSAGKSTLQAAVIHWLLNHREWNADMVRNPEKMKDLLAAWEQGTIQSTRLNDLNADGIDITLGAMSTPRRLFFYDPAGESFENRERLSEHRHYRYLTCSIVIIDPFALNDVKSKMKVAGIEVGADVHASPLSTESVFGKWKLAMDEEHQNRVKKTYCAIVINKMDRPEIQKLSGLKPGAGSEECRQFLEDNGLASVVSQAQEFKAVSYFAVSSLSPQCCRIPATAHRSSSGVISLMNWISANCIS